MESSNNTVVHYLSHNADDRAENQPSYQVQQVIDGSLDIAAVWGPMAGYYKTIMHAPLIIKPVNLMEDQIPMEFDMTLAVPRGRPDIKSAVQNALEQHKDEIHQILVDFGVPLVQVQGLSGVGRSSLARSVRRAAAGHRDRRRPAEGTSCAHGGTQEVAGAGRKSRQRACGCDRRPRHGPGELPPPTWRARRIAKDGEGNTLLINAVRFGFVDVTTVLLEHGADPNQTNLSNWTPLMYAAWDDSAEIANLLIKHGAKLEAVDNDGLTPLAIACQNAKIKAAEALVAAGADVNAPVAKGGYTPLMLASLSGSSDLVTALIAHGAKVNAVNPGGVTALMIAAANDRRNVVAVLLKSGADVNARSEDGRTALSIAQANNNEALIQVLKDAAQHGGSAASG